MRRLATSLATLALASCSALAFGAGARAAVVATTRADVFLTVGGTVVQEDHDPLVGLTPGPTTAQSYIDESDYQLGAYGQATQTGSISASATAISGVGPDGSLGRIQADGGAETLLEYTAASNVRAYLDFSVDYLKVAAVNGQVAGVGDVFNAIYGYAFVQIDGLNQFADSNLFTFSVLDNGPQYIYEQRTNAALTNLTNTVQCSGFQCDSDDVNVAAVAGTLDLGLLSAGQLLSVDYVLNARAYADMVYRVLDDGSERAFLGIANGTVDDYCGVACGLHYARLRFVEVPGEPGGGAVPEPSTWALMIAGFGLAGAALRRRAANLSPA